MKIKNQSGFAALEAVLLVVILAILAGTGYYVWHVQQDTNKLNTESVNQSQPLQRSPAPTYAKNSATGTIHYHNTLGKFSVDYPSSWVHIDSTSKLCSGALDRDLEIAPNLRSLARCASDGTVCQVSISSVKNDQTQSPAYVFLDGKTKGWVNLQQTTVTAGGVKGISYSGTAKGQVGLGAYPDNAKVVEDVFFENNSTYIATYTQYPSSSTEGPTQDQYSQFVGIVGTLKFE